MTLTPGLWARTDQLVEEARRSIRHVDLARQPQVAEMLSDIVLFLNRADHSQMDLRLHVLAFIELLQTIRRDPPCSDSSSPGSSP